LAKYIGGLAKNDKSVSYHESKITEVLHGVLSGAEKVAQVVLEVMLTQLNKTMKRLC